ncbi:MAG TPA: hypothetical protein VNP04_31705 [Alphaproteobacteria bacterium]|nr:hypothetical protein [Alphaproteobacteria bacterium]
MRSALGQVQERAPTPQTTPHNGAPPMVKEIPYDYVATFALQGKRGNRVQDVINISTDGAFIAVSIGYSFISELTKHITLTKLGNPNGTGSVVWSLNGKGDLQDPPGDLGGIDVDFLLAQGSAQTLPPAQDHLVNPVALLQCLLVQTCGIDFKYSIVDSGSGRELQNQPIHNIAGLGKADGERPFRPLAKPMLFMPRSTIRIEIEEVSEGLLYKDSLLYIVLHGYKMLNYGTGLP